MAQEALKGLVAKLNDICHKTLDEAANLTFSRTHYNIEIEHWLVKLADRPTSDISLLLNHFGLDTGQLLRDLNKAIDRFTTGNGRPPAISPRLVTLLREAWNIASLEQGGSRIRSSHVFAAALDSAEFGPLLRDASPQLARLPQGALTGDLAAVLEPSDESAGDRAAPAGEPARPGSQEALDRFTIDLTKQASEGRIDPIVGRDPEVRQIIDILTRRRQNNPILTGEAGVGKTAVVEGFALRIVAGDVPDSLKNTRLLSLDLGLLQAGAGVKGEFENRLKQVIAEVKSSPTPIIMFIDEAHTLIGAGGAEGQGDAANLLKPALARGDMRTIAATTWAEYKKYFEKDPALTRRFQVVKVEEPDEATATAMLRGLVPVLEKHHSVRILSEALEAASTLSHRYIAGRQLPDKAISLLDTACARVGVSQAAKPPALEDLDRRMGLVDAEIAMLERDDRAGVGDAEALERLRSERQRLTVDQAAVTERWTKERDAAFALRDARVALEGEDTPETRAAFGTARDAVEAVRGPTPLVYDVVDAQVIAEVLAGWTGIPVGRMLKDEVNAILRIEGSLGERIKGQDFAIRTIAESVQTARAGLADPRKPLGVFLFCGTSGVGKTETALALAELLYGGEQNLTTINMSEFKEEHKVSLLVGSPPGYVGYGEGGILTEAVRRKPYSVVLLDEMEKAHPGVQDIFYQVFDKGQLKDGQGRDIDFRNTLVIMTSNAGTQTIEDLCRDKAEMPDAQTLAAELRPALLDYFKPAFLGRTVIVPYFPLPREILREIVTISLKRIRQRVAANYGASFDWDVDLLDRVVDRCTETESGARNVENILKRGLLADLAQQLLVLRADGAEPSAIFVSAGADGQDYAVRIDCLEQNGEAVTSEDVPIEAVVNQ